MLNPQLTAPDIHFDVVREYPHDPTAYTEGLEFYGGFLYESTGGDTDHQPPSTLRRVDLSTGHILNKIVVNEKHFAEGLTIFGPKLFQLTDKSHIALVYDLTCLGPARTLLKYKGWDRGWGLTNDDRYLILSDSTEQIHFIDPRSFEIVRTIIVKDGVTLVRGLNELEYINGSIYGNLYPFDLILRIDPLTGNVFGKIDISTLGPKRTILCPTCVPNGIAHNEESGNLFVTGKRWPTLYEIRLRPG